MATKIFNVTFTVILALSIIFGFICPYLISANSDALVTLGFLMILGVIYVAGNRISKIVDSGEKK